MQTKQDIFSYSTEYIGKNNTIGFIQKSLSNISPTLSNEQTLAYPSTRYMGSKSKLLSEIWHVASQFDFDTAIDLFSGSGVVGYMLKSNGKSVISNDYMAMSSTFAKAMIENNSITLSEKEALLLLEPSEPTDHFVEKTFKDLYFLDEDNQLIDIIRANIKVIEDSYKRDIAMSALIRTCLKKRPRGIFTYVGQRYDDGRKDLLMSFRDQFLNAVKVINSAVFDNGKHNKAHNLDAMVLNHQDAELVYIDPPYYSSRSDNEYVRRYHFVEGLARDWQGVEIQQHTLTKKFKSYPTPFASRKGAIEAFNMLFKKFSNSVLIISYSSNSLPTMDEMLEILKNYKKNVEVLPIDYTYSFGTQSHKVGNNRNKVQEYIFVGY